MIEVVHNTELARIEMRSTDGTIAAGSYITKKMIQEYPKAAWALFLKALDELPRAVEECPR